MVARAEQYRLSFQVDTCLAVLQDMLDDILDLCRFVRRQDQLRPLPGWLMRKELFAESFCRLRDNRVARLQNWLSSSGSSARA